jgi:formylglycine-generating enzyme required for sulfatase activity
MHGFYMDKYPVTNGEYEQFLKKSDYQPKDTVNFLKHWRTGKPVKGEEDLPVIWVSREDAIAYATWAGKRLPEEREWQYAAQGTNPRKYPWGDEKDSLKCNYNLNHPTPVNQFPPGASYFGVEDMVGNVWQLMADLYDNGCYYFSIIRGGSYYHPKSSIWYVTGGPLPVDHPEMLLLIAPSLDRNATVGFRCAKDMAD